jgi:hypothetical protein
MDKTAGIAALVALTGAETFKRSHPRLCDRKT